MNSDNHTAESAVVSMILHEFGRQPGLRIWRANTGAARDRYSGRVVRFGVPGQADISGIYHRQLACPHCSGSVYVGQRVEIECKSTAGRLSEQQERYKAMIEMHGGLYVVARGADAVEAVQDALR